MMEYIPRALLNEIIRYIDRREIISIKGPRQSGKTTLLKMLKDFLINEKNIDEDHIIYLTFEDNEILYKFSENPKDFIRKYITDSKRYYFLIDEAQYCKDLGKKLKLIYDLFENIKIIITGSSSLELKNETARYLVGRLLEFELYPLNFYEFLLYNDQKIARIYKEWNEKVINLLMNSSDFEIKKDVDIYINDLLKYLNEYIKFGGYPAIVTAESEKEKIFLLKNLVNTYLDKDVVSFLNIRDTIKFRRLITALASLNGSLINITQLANEINSYFKEIIDLLDILEQTYIIRRIRPFHKNLVTELKKENKIYFIDTGLRNYLINNFNDIEIRNDSGTLIENFILNELYQYGKINFWRTKNKAEVDFIFEGKEIIPTEVKFSNIKRDILTRSLYYFIRNYNSRFSIVVTKNYWGERIINNGKIKYIPLVYF
ncbi:MAG: ATP-binding protein [Candidatus Nanopusillus sp.]